MSALFEKIRENVTELIHDAQASASDGMTGAEAWGLFLNCQKRVVQIVEASGATGAEKKEAAVLACEEVYAQVIAPIDIPSIPNFLEPVVDNAIGRTIRPIVSATIDFLVATFNETKLFSKAP